MHTNMIEHQQQNTQLKLNDLYDVNYKLVYYQNNLQNSPRSISSRTSIKKNLKSLDRKITASDDSLTLSISAAVAELRPCPEILPFSVDLPIKVKMSPLVKQISAPALATTSLPVSETEPNISSSNSCTSGKYNADEITGRLFELDCLSNKDLINDFFLSDHYLMPENKHTQKKQSCDVTLTHTRRNFQFVDWNEGMCEWYPSNPYPPFKYYLRSFKQLRTKQQNHFEFDPVLGFHLPVKRTQQAAVGKPAPVNNNRPIIGHFHVPNNVAKRLDQQNRPKKYSDENDFNSHVVYPFMETGPHQQTLIFGGQTTIKSQSPAMSRLVDQLQKQRQLPSNQMKLSVRNHSFPSFQDSDSVKITGYSDQASIIEFKNQAESMLYSNATRILQMRSKELDRVKNNQQIVYNLQNLSELHSNFVLPIDKNSASYTPPPPPPPPPPPHKQEHLSSTPIARSKPPVSRSQTVDTDQKPKPRTYADIEASRIKSYNEGANIFKINKIRDFTPDLDSKLSNSIMQKEFLRNNSVVDTDKTKCKVLNVGTFKTMCQSSGVSIEPTHRVDNSHNNCEHDAENCRCVTEIKSNIISLTEKINENSGYVNYQMSKNPIVSYQSPTYATQQQQKPKKEKKVKKTVNLIEINASSINPPISVYNPFLIASSQPLGLTGKFDFNNNNSNNNSKVGSASTYKKDSSEEKPTSSSSPSAETIATSLPPIISGKQIKLPLGPHSGQELRRSKSTHILRKPINQSLLLMDMHEGIKEYIARHRKY